MRGKAVNIGQERTGEWKRRVVRSGRMIRRSKRRVTGTREYAEDVGSEEIVGERKTAVPVKRRQLD